MAIVKIPDQGITYDTFEACQRYLASIGIEHEMWKPSTPVSEDASADEILDAYKPEIDALKERGGYVTADVIDVKPTTDNLDAMLAKFAREHYHDEDEVRFCIKGRGVFHIHPEGGPIVSIEVGAGDLIRVPRGTHHWFDLCGDKRIRCIRLFQDTAGWTPHYTNTGAEVGYMPICMGPSFIASEESAELQRIRENRVL